jgi:glycosyltransferase involved in cell wall biosynthesis
LQAVKEKGQPPKRVLVVFNTLCFYGMERSVIETFDLLRPEVVPHFLIPQSNERYHTGPLCEIRKRNFSFSFFSDTWDWPRVGKPRSLAYAVKLCWSVVLANWDVLRNCVHNDVVYLPAVSSAYYSLLACLYYLVLNRKVVYFFHNVVLRPSRTLKPVIWLSTDLVHCAERSRQMVDRSNPAIGARSNHVIPPCIEIRSSGALDLSQWQGKRIILFAGQVSAHKGLDLLSEAFMELTARHDNIALHIVGGCQTEFPGWFEDLLRQSRPWVDIKYWGYVNDVHDLFRAAYVYVHPTPPSRCHESFGRGVVEAMALGIPAVCFRSGPLEEIVVHAQTGLICEQESSRCLAENLGRFLDDAQFRNRCAQQARQRYIECYSDGPIRTAWMELLQNRPA